MRRQLALLRRLKELEMRDLPWVDNDDDNFLTAVGALPGESAHDALNRWAGRDWEEYVPST